MKNELNKQSNRRKNFGFLNIYANVLSNFSKGQKELNDFLRKGTLKGFEIKNFQKKKNLIPY